MEIIYNTTIIALTILAVVNVWGVLGYLIVKLTGAKPTSVSALMVWPAVLVELAIDAVTEWLDKQ